MPHPKKAVVRGIRQPLFVNVDVVTGTGDTTIRYRTCPLEVPSKIGRSTLINILPISLHSVGEGQV